MDDYPRGSLYLELPKITETSVFHTKIYDDGIEVIVQNTSPLASAGWAMSALAWMQMAT